MVENIDSTNELSTLKTKKEHICQDMFLIPSSLNKSDAKPGDP